MAGQQLGFDVDGMQAAAPESQHAVRLELTALLDRAKAARDAAPWDRDTQQKYRTLVPERVKALPPEEAEFMRRQFVMEFDRIDLLLAA